MRKSHREGYPNEGKYEEKSQVLDQHTLERNLQGPDKTKHHTDVYHSKKRENISNCRKEREKILNGTCNIQTIQKYKGVGARGGVDYATLQFLKTYFHFGVSNSFNRERKREREILFESVPKRSLFREFYQPSPQKGDVTL